MVVILCVHFISKDQSSQIYTLYVRLPFAKNYIFMSQDIFDIYGYDPFVLLKQWYTEAEKSEPHDPDAVCLATADAHGRPSARMVLIKQMDERGFRFHTNSESRKGQDLEENPYAALCFYWKSLRKQVRAEGHIERVTVQEADDYFASRPRERKIGAWASDQSRIYPSGTLQGRIAEVESRFEGIDDIPRPPYWNGYNLVPARIEFWIAHKDRLHTRFEYVRTANGWDARWVYP